MDKPIFYSSMKWTNTGKEKIRKVKPKGESFERYILRRLKL